MMPFDKLKIALDYDDTYSVNREMWDQILMIMIVKYRCDVRFVTYRFVTDDNIDIETDSQRLGVAVVYCGGVQKHTVCERIEWDPDIWIDDMPVLIPNETQLRGILKGIEVNGG